VSWASFKEATLISAFSMVDITRKLLNADVFNPDGSVLTISYRGSQVAVEGYNMMGPVKIYLSLWLGGLQVN